MSIIVSHVRKDRQPNSGFLKTRSLKSNTITGSEKSEKVTYENADVLLPAEQRQQPSAAVATFFEILADSVSIQKPAEKHPITIWTKKSTIEIPADLPETLIVKALKAVAHAL